MLNQHSECSFPRVYMVVGRVPERFALKRSLLQSRARDTLASLVRFVNQIAFPETNKKLEISNATTRKEDDRGVTTTLCKNFLFRLEGGKERDGYLSMKYRWTFFLLNP